MSTDLSTTSYHIDGRPLLAIVRPAGQGDFSCRLRLDETGIVGEMAMAFNFLMDLLQRSTEEMHRVITFAIRDTGIGISPDKCNVIFEPFQQGDTGTARKYGGTGLGLSISREIAQLLGGAIRLESTVGKGSTFTLYLPDAWESPSPARTQDSSPSKEEEASARENGRDPGDTPARKPAAGGALPLDTGQTATVGADGDRIRRALVVEDNEIERLGITALINNESLHVTAVPTGAEALAAFADRSYDLVILDLKLPDISGIEVLQKMAVFPNFLRGQILVYTGVEISHEEEKELTRLSEAIIHKDEASPQLLIAEIQKCLANPQPTSAPAKPACPTDGASGVFRGKKVLAVDDDYRNVFAIAAVLEQEGIEVLAAESGQEALKQLQEAPGIDLVLMDIMMPEMDGYEAMRRIRAIDRFRSVPVIALTAKAMKGDREKCLEAGASDYVAKPVDRNRLLEVVRCWICGPQHAN